MKIPHFDSSGGLYKRLLIRCILVVIGILFFLFVFPKALHLLFPFVIAFLVATILNPFVEKINQKLGISRRIIALVLDLLVFLVVFSLIGALAYAVASEAITLATNIQLDWDRIGAKFDGVEKSFAWLFGMLPPQVADFLSGFEENVVSFIQNTSKNLLSSILSAATTMTTKTGSFFINFFMAILAAYFTIVDYDRIAALAKKYMGKRASGYLSILKRSVMTSLGGYFKSQLLLALSAFLFMFTVLGIYGQPYALLIALCLGIIDLLPIVGTIAVLIPWGIIEFISGNPNKGIFLIIIGVVFFLIRRIIEPKIVGSQTGLHPLAALMSIYVGLQFSGVWGAILGPVILMLCISVVRSGILDNTIADLKAVAHNVSKTLNKTTENQP